MSNTQFLKTFLKNAKQTGSIIPSSRYLGMAIAELVDTRLNSNIVEIGAGTGAITDHIAHLQPTLVEIDKNLCDLLRQKYPQCPIENKCAVEFLDVLSSKVILVITIPLINNP